MNWLVKEEPSNYNFAQFQQGQAHHLVGRAQPGRAAQPALDAEGRPRVLLPHRRREGGGRHGQGGRRAGAGPDDATGKLYVVELACDAPLPAPVTLKAIKADARFADFALVRIPRLSVMPVTDQQWGWIEKFAARDWRRAARHHGRDYRAFGRVGEDCTSTRRRQRRDPGRGLAGHLRLREQPGHGGARPAQRAGRRRESLTRPSRCRTARSCGSDRCCEGGAAAGQPRPRPRSWKPAGAAQSLTSPTAASAGASRLTSTLSMRRPSMSTTSKRIPLHSKLSAVRGMRPSRAITKPPSVW